MSMAGDIAALIGFRADWDKAMDYALKAVKGGNYDEAEFFGIELFKTDAAINRVIQEARHREAHESPVV